MCIRMWYTIERNISTSTQDPFTIEHRVGVGGGSINESYRVEGMGQYYFVKVNAAERLDMFIAEAKGLEALASVRAMRVPLPICWGIAAWLSTWILQMLAHT